jgi:hypothetical protein
MSRCQEVKKGGKGQRRILWSIDLGHIKCYKDLE